METKLWILEEGPQVNIHPDGLKATLKKISNRKTPGLDGIHRFWFNVPADDMENNNGTYKGEDLLLIDNPRNLPRRTERTP